MRASRSLLTTPAGAIEKGGWCRCALELDGTAQARPLDWFFGLHGCEVTSGWLDSHTRKRRGLPVLRK